MNFNRSPCFLSESVSIFGGIALHFQFLDLNPQAVDVVDAQAAQRGQLGFVGMQAGPRPILDFADLVDGNLSAAAFGRIEQLDDRFETDVLDQAGAPQAWCLERNNVQGRDVHRIDVGFGPIGSVEWIQSGWSARILPHGFSRSNPTSGDTSVMG